MKCSTADTENLTKACGTVLLIDRECTGKMWKLHHILVHLEGSICKERKWAQMTLNNSAPIISLEFPRFFKSEILICKST